MHIERLFRTTNQRHGRNGCRSKRIMLHKEMIEVVVANGSTRVIISTVYHTKVEPIPGLLEANPLTHIEALDLNQVPGVPTDYRK